MNGQELYAIFADQLAQHGGRPEQWWFIEQSHRNAWDRTAERLTEEENERQLDAWDHGC